MLNNPKLQFRTRPETTEKWKQKKNISPGAHGSCGQQPPSSAGSWVAELSEFTNSGNATSQELDTVVIKASGVVPFSVMLKNRVISE